jgi:GNAT superfamily N-acetyltransferase
MNRSLFILVIIALASGLAFSQTKQSPTPSPRPTPPTQPQPQQGPSFALADYGVAFQSDPRLIVVMAALDAAGFDPTPAGREPSVFRARVKKDQEGLDPALRERLHTYYELHRLPAPATMGDQAARYVSLAYVLGAPPLFEPPDNSDELPAGVLEVLDFSPLLREFYRRSGVGERLVSYARAYQAEGDRLHAPVAEMVRAILSYLHTRPVTISSERIVIRAPTAKKKPNNAPKAYALREHDRRFYIVPDLLAAPGTTNLRVIADDYYAIVPEGADPAASELRRAYLQYVIDPLMMRFNKEIAEQREPIKRLLKERETSGASVTPDVFLSVSRSLVTAADLRFQELVKLQALGFELRERLPKAKDEAARSRIIEEIKASVTNIQDDTIADLADEYERGSVLAFFFADKLQEVETSGFDIVSFFPDMMTSLDAARESHRLKDVADARTRALAARAARLAKRSEPDPTYNEADTAKGAALVKALSEIEQILRQKDYNDAEVRLRELIKEYPREPRVFFAIAQTASIAASDATDEEVQSKRLNDALSNYRLALAAASPETDSALISRAHEAMGRIHAFLDHKPEAASEFDAAIKIGDVRGGAYKEAIAGRKKLDQPK